MDLAKSRFIRRSLLKGGRGDFQLISPAPRPIRILKIQRHLVQQLAIRILTANAGTKIHRVFVNSGIKSAIWKADQCLHLELNKSDPPPPPLNSHMHLSRLHIRVNIYCIQYYMLHRDKKD
jgi:hypothetical protein